MNLKGQQVLITGASRGIGWALAQRLAKEQVHLHLVARSWMEGQDSRIRELGAPSVRLWTADLSLTSGISNLVQGLEKENIAIDILVNNAGQLTSGLLEEQNPDDIDRMLAVNVGALIRLTRLLLPGMLHRGRGKIVNNASVSGKMFFPCASTYAASKAAVVAFTESIKQELRGTGVSTLLMITPGVKTEMYDEIAHLYGSHLDLSFMNSIPAEEWSDRITRAIQTDADTLWPSGASRWGVWVGHHFPGAFARLLRSRFRR